MGTGHVMRCIALAQAWQDLGGRATLLSSCLPSALAAQVTGNNLQHVAVEGCAGSIGDAVQLCRLHQDIKASWAIVDGYHFDETYLAYARNIQGRLMMIDDLGHLSHYSVDLVLNQNITASESLYPIASATTRFLLGGKHALLRREFCNRPNAAHQEDVSSNNVLVMMGGSDPENVTIKVLHAMLNMPTIQTRVIVGGLNPHLQSLQRLADQSAGKVTLLVNVQNIIEEMDWADLAISAGGTSVLELASRQVPTFLISIATNQVAIATALQEQKIMKYLGWHETVDEALIESATRAHFFNAPTEQEQKEAARRYLELCDGQGAARVARHLQQNFACGQASHRDISFWVAQQEDREIIYEWAQDPASRQASFHSASIPWDVHCSWFAQKIASPCSILWVCRSVRNEKTGLIRIDIQNEAAVISINIAPKFRGIGLGWKMIAAACEIFAKQFQALPIKAYIKLSNAASIRVFEKAGFQHQEDAETPEGALCLVLNTAKTVPEQPTSKPSTNFPS